MFLSDADSVVCWAVWEGDFPLRGITGIPLYMGFILLLAIVQKKVSKHVTPKYVGSGDLNMDFAIAVLTSDIGTPTATPFLKPCSYWASSRSARIGC